MKVFFMLLCFAAGNFSGCASIKTHSIAADLRNGCKNMQVSSVEVDVDGSRNAIFEEQAFTIIQGCLSSITVEDKKNYGLEIKMYDRSFLSDAAFLHSVFISIFIYDGENNPVAVISEYSTGKDSFQSPEVQEKFIRKCIYKINDLRL